MKKPRTYKEKLEQLDADKNWIKKLNGLNKVAGKHGLWIKEIEINLKSKL